jgi:hypothetical protein
VRINSILPCTNTHSCGQTDLHPCPHTCMHVYTAHCETHTACTHYTTDHAPEHAPRTPCFTMQYIHAHATRSAPVPPQPHKHTLTRAHIHTTARVHTTPCSHVPQSLRTHNYTRAHTHTRHASSVTRNAITKVTTKWRCDAYSEIFICLFLYSRDYTVYQCFSKCSLNYFHNNIEI